MVDYQKTPPQGVPRPTRGLDWAKLLKPLGLESPGYQETLASFDKVPYVAPKKRKKKS